MMMAGLNAIRVTQALSERYIWRHGSVNLGQEPVTSLHSYENVDVTFILTFYCDRQITV